LKSERVVNLPCPIRFRALREATSLFSRLLYRGFQRHARKSPTPDQVLITAPCGVTPSVMTVRRCAVALVARLRKHTAAQQIFASRSFRCPVASPVSPRAIRGFPYTFGKRARCFDEVCGSSLFDLPQLTSAPPSLHARNFVNSAPETARDIWFCVHVPSSGSSCAH